MNFAKWVDYLWLCSTSEHLDHCGCLEFDVLLNVSSMSLQRHGPSHIDLEILYDATKNNFYLFEKKAFKSNVIRLLFTHNTFRLSGGST